MSEHQTDIISVATARTLDGLFRERVRRSPDRIAYRYFDQATQRWQASSWADMALEVERWRAALLGEGYSRGDRVAVLVGNSREWVIFDQAAFAAGLVVVPLFPNDNAENIAYILNDSEARLLLIHNDEHWAKFGDALDQLSGLQRILTLTKLSGVEDDRVRHVAGWCPAEAPATQPEPCRPEDLATIVYTSGTTGRPKGVMLSHHNILTNAHSGVESIDVYTDDLFLSFLPLSHMFERTVGYYLPMMTGSTVAYARSIPQLADDLVELKPTVLISVPRIYERVYAKIKAGLDEKPPIARKLFTLAVDVGWQSFLHRQGRAPWRPSLLLQPLLQKLVGDKVMARLGGRMRLSVCGGAALSESVGRTFIGLGLQIAQGYGLTETSPVISVNRLDDNDPASVGPAVPGTEVKLGDNDELLVRTPGIMMGYWKNPDATTEMIDADGWLHTGDKATIGPRGHIYITGRIKEIIVMATGEKIPPADMEAAILDDPLFEQCMLVGEARPYICAMLVLNTDHWTRLCEELRLDPGAEASLRNETVENTVVERIAAQTRSFPSYAQVRRVCLTLEPWTVENGLLTPTLKVRRNEILARSGEEVARMYAGH